MVFLGMADPSVGIEARVYGMSREGARGTRHAIGMDGVVFGIRMCKDLVNRVEDEEDEVVKDLRKAPYILFAIFFAIVAVPVLRLVNYETGEVMSLLYSDAMPKLMEEWAIAWDRFWSNLL